MRTPDGDRSAVVTGLGLRRENPPAEAERTIAADKCKEEERSTPPISGVLDPKCAEPDSLGDSRTGGLPRCARSSCIKLELLKSLVGGPTSRRSIVLPTEIFRSLLMAMLARNIFLDIIEKRIPAQILREDDLCLAFADINPKAPTHVLIIPRKEIRTHGDVTPDDERTLGRMHLMAAQLARDLGITDYRLVINCNEGAGQTVPHLHLHLLAGRPFSWPPG
jgi:histidine triad (HIT) family protein